MSKVLLIIGAVLVIVGLLFFVVTMSICGWDFGTFSAAGRVERTFEVSGDFENISISSETADFAIRPSEDGECRVVCIERERLGYRVAVADGALTVSEKEERKWYDYIFSFGQDSITVYLPRSEYSALMIEGDTADVNILGGFSFASMDISLDTGTVRTSASVSGDAKIKTSTGDIYVEDATLGSLGISSSTGSAHLAGVNVCGAVMLTRSTGKVYINDLVTSDKMTINVFIFVEKTVFL